jgi:hypothetical protein
MTLVAWRPAPGSDTTWHRNPIFEPVGEYGLTGPDGGPFRLGSDVPSWFPNLQAILAELPDEPLVETSGIYRDFEPGSTAVPFVIHSAVGMWNPRLDCQTPAGPGMVRLPYAVIPGLARPFTIKFPSASIPDDATTEDFVCTLTEFDPLDNAPLLMKVLLMVEQVSYDTRDGDLGVSIGMFNPTDEELTFAGFSISGFMYSGEAVVAYGEARLDELVLPPRSYFRLDLAAYGEIYDREAVEQAFADPENVSWSWVVPGIFERP